MAGAASGTTVDVYSSLPMQGSSGAQTTPMANGIKLALSAARKKAGKFTVKYTQFDDSTAAAGKWDPTQSAANTYVGLTANLPGSAAGEPGKYYPGGTRNFLRIVPIDSIQAASDLMATIARLGSDGSNKADVLKALFALKGTSSALGTFGFDKDGDTTLKSYGLYKVGADGMPAFLKTLTPAKAVG